MENNQSVDRIFQLIEIVAASGDGMGITEMARNADLPKSTVHRIASALVEKNYLQKDEASGRYKLGFRFIAIAGDYVDSLDLRSAASPYLHGLSAALGTTVHLAILRGDKAVYIEKIQPYTHTCMYSEIGKPIDLYCSALGKSLMLDFSSDRVEEYLRNTEFKQYTAFTLDKDGLIEEVLSAKKTHLTRDNAEHENGVYCLATPVINYKNKVIAAISISGIKPDVLTDPKYGNALKQAGESISRLFGKK